MVYRYRDNHGMKNQINSLHKQVKPADLNDSPDSGESNNSRKELMERLGSMGFSVDQFESCTVDQLQHLAQGANWLRRTYEDVITPSSGEGDAKLPGSISTKNVFTEVDKKVLRSLLASSGRVSSLSLSRKLEIPLTTVQRRRKRLESEFLEVAYTLRLDKLGWRRADLLISTNKGKTASVGKDLLSHSAITRVCRSIGQHTIDLHAEAVFKNNSELLNIIEWIKSLEGAKDVVYTEPVELLGKNTSIDIDIIDKHL
jgi:DNA-binding Lrp family transcriptional regulator